MAQQSAIETETHDSSRLELPLAGPAVALLIALNPERAP
jgi:hypothetical protein